VGWLSAIFSGSETALALKALLAMALTSGAMAWLLIKRRSNGHRSPNATYPPLPVPLPVAARLPMPYSEDVLRLGSPQQPTIAERVAVVETRIDDFCSRLERVEQKVDKTPEETAKAVLNALGHATGGKS
jgi:hypothetical protein